MFIDLLPREFYRPFIFGLALLAPLWLLSHFWFNQPTVPSRWNGSHSGLVGVAQPLPPQTILGTANLGMAFLPLPPDGPFRQNVLEALNAREGALRSVRIAPGETWSFNRTVGNPAPLQLTTINGIYGGGWCDLASRYVVALRPLLPPESFSFVRHRDVAGIGIAGVTDDNAVSIWNTNNTGDEQDLVILNRTNRPILILATLNDAGIMVQASFEH